jgi:uncharacterized membrane protein
MNDDHRPGNGFYWQEGARHAHHEWWHGPLHAVLLLLLVALLVVGVVWIVRRLSPAPPTLAAAPAAAPLAATATDPAVVTLRMRYAKGEVSREDFLHTMDDLTGAAVTAAPPWPGTTPGEDTEPTAS